MRKPTRREFFVSATAAAAGIAVAGLSLPVNEADLFRNALNASWRIRDVATRGACLTKLLPMATTLRDRHGVRQVVRATADRALTSGEMALRAEVAGTAVLVGTNLGDHCLLERALDAVESGRKARWTIERYRSDADFLRSILAVASLPQATRILALLDAVPTGPMNVSGFADIHGALLRFHWWQGPHLDHEARSRCHSAICRFADLVWTTRYV